MDVETPGSPFGPGLPGSPFAPMLPFNPGGPSGPGCPISPGIPFSPGFPFGAYSNNAEGPVTPGLPGIYAHVMSFLNVLHH